MDKKETTRVLNNNKDLLALYYKVVDKLEKRIATLEKVLDSHAKCIGHLQEEKFIPIRKDQIDDIEKELEK
tara:strand:+ start:66 stop:278 length:213 start_codon:yes stop_codon:yes gene_type:complete